MAMTVMFNGVQYAPVSCKMSIVVPIEAEVLWSVVGKFGKQALWMGTVEGQPIFTQLLGGETADYVGAARVFGIADKLLFEQLTRLDNVDMLMCWQLMTHPMNSNPFPAAYVNCKASLQVIPITIPGGSALVQWRIELLTEQHHVAHMTKAIDDIMIVGLTNLIKYMNKASNNSSGGHSSTGTQSGGVVGSLHAPSAYGVQFMPQPSPAMSQFPTQSLNQAMHPGALTGNSPFLQQPTFVPAPGESLAGSNAPSQTAPTAPAAAAAGHQQQPQHSQYMQQPHNPQQYMQQPQQQQYMQGPQQQQYMPQHQHMPWQQQQQQYMPQPQYQQPQPGLSQASSQLPKSMSAQQLPQQAQQQSSAASLPQAEGKQTSQS